MAESNLRMEGSRKKCNLVGFKTRLPPISRGQLTHGEHSKLHDVHRCCETHS